MVKYEAPKKHVQDEKKSESTRDEELYTSKVGRQTPSYQRSRLAR